MGWKWDNVNDGDKLLLVNRNVARDKNLFRPPVETSYPQVGMLHTFEVSDQIVSWQWPGDDRVFLIPLALFQNVKFNSLVRDIIVWCGQCYRDHHFPNDNWITAYSREIARGIGLAWNGKTIGEQIERIFNFIKSYTINNYLVIQEVNKDGSVKKAKREPFGFIDRAGRIIIDNSIPVPRNKQRYEIKLSDLYTDALKNLPPAPLPVKALEVAHAAPWRIQSAVKNMAYYLAGRVPKKDPRLLIATCREICGFIEQPAKYEYQTRQAVERVFGILYPIMISDYRYVDKGYEIQLAGKASTKRNTD